MLITAPILSKGSFFGSLVNKCRPIIAANISTTAPVLKTIEERMGLPARPKKPLTPYFRYMKDVRPKLTAENPKLSTPDIVRLVSKKWETVDLKEKERMQAEYKREQEKYIETCTKYNAKLTEEQRAEMKQLKQDIKDEKERRVIRKRIKQLGRPKRPGSAFLKFLSKERIRTPQHPTESYRDWHRKCADKWAQFTDEQKASYMEESRKEFVKYKQEISAWEEKMIRLGNIDVVRHGNLIDPPEPKSKKN
ncbi:transcription factor A, mitochondrial isoform X2 [Teleopsis dalmanni]|uniref:transcription factor A, mitochondrial isoform X2 n=1 Tax=Teleopsis dalmanni TaxID=139649 RepID=UPI0018CE1D4C|nr:transcription factor A, mitochondrial isoform X2 [Teleopsis dalmanni]